MFFLKLKLLVEDMQSAVMLLYPLCRVGGVGLLTVAEVQLLPRDTHWPEHHWQPLVFAVQL